MPLYFFNVVDGQFLVDDTGTECAGVSEMRAMAITTAGAMLRERGATLSNGVEWQMHVTDATKKTVFKLRFSAEDI